MALHPEFPDSPYAPLTPEHRWFPADEAIRDTAYEKLLPPLVAEIRTEPREFVAAKKSVFNRIVGEANAGGLELAFASFVEDAADCQAFAKNYLAVGFKIDYVKKNGDLSTYTPDFIARDQNGTVWIIETKGREEIDVPQKMSRLALWYDDATVAEKEAGNSTRYAHLFIDEASFKKHQPATLADLATSFTDYK